MAFDTRIALAALLLGTAAPAGMLWAQTATPTTTPAEAGDTAATGAAAPAADAAGTPATGTAGTEGSAAPATPAPEAAAETPATTGTDGTAAPAATTPATTTPATTTPATTTTATPAPAAPGAPVPAATPADAQVGAFYVDATHGDWTLRCQKTPDNRDPCELYQLMKDAGGNAVAEVSMIPLEGNAAAGATLVAPLETDLVPGIGFRIDAGKQQAYPFSFCAPVGCISRVGFTQAELDALKRGNRVTVSLMPYGAPADRRVDLGLSLAGFTAGWDALKAKPPVSEAASDLLAPAAGAPAAAAPAGAAPAADAAATDAPAANAPAADTPAADTPAAETPAAETPAPAGN